MNRKISVSVSVILALLMLLSTFAFAIGKVDIKSITFEKPAISIAEGAQTTLTVKLNPSNAAVNQLRWTSSNSNVAVVNYQGTVTGIKEGVATITATSSVNSTVTAKCTITVTGKAKAVEIQIPVYERGTAGQQPADTGYWAKWISEKALQDINIKVKYISIPRSGHLDRFNLLLASNTAPDLIFSYDYADVSGWYNRGVFQEISPKMLSENGPNLIKWLGDSRLKYGKFGGKQYLLDAKRAIVTDYRYIEMIRQDWLDKLGMQIPTTEDEYYQVLKAFKTKDPGNLGSQNVIPLAQDYNTNSGYSVFSTTGNYPWRPDNMSEEEKALYSDITFYALTWEPEMKRLLWYNKAYNEGLVSPEFMLDLDGSRARAAFVNGKAGVWAMYMASNGTIETLMQNVPTARLSALPKLTLKKNQVASGYLYTPPVGMMNGISKNSKNPDAVIKFLDWMCKPEILDKLQFGNEGKTFNVNSNGVKTIVSGYSGDDRMLNGSNKDYYCVVAENLDKGDDYKTMQYNNAISAPKGFEYLMEDMYKNLSKPKYVGTPNVMLNKALTTGGKYQTTLTTKAKNAVSALITCNPSQFQTLYSSLCKDYLDSGYQQILDEKRSIYHEMMGIK